MKFCISFRDGLGEMDMHIYLSTLPLNESTKRSAGPEGTR